MGILENGTEQSRPGIYNVVRNVPKNISSEASTAHIEITKPCHIAELKPGVYLVKNDFVGDYKGKVTIANVKADGKTIDDDYFTLNCGLLVVFENIKDKEDDGMERSIVGFTAQGLITVPNQSYTGDFLTAQKTITNTTSIQGYLLQSYYMPESEDSTKPTKWFSGMPDIVMSDIPASAMVDEITEESTIYEFPNAKAVYNFGQSLQTGGGSSGSSAQSDYEQNDPTASDYIKNRPFYSEYKKMTDILEVKEYEFVDNEGTAALMLEMTSLPPVIEGTPYNFTFGDTVEQVTFAYNENAEGYLAGNLSIMGMGDDTGETYLIGVMGSEGEYSVAIFTTESAGTYTVGLSYVSDNVPLILNGTYTFGEMGE